MLITHTVTKHTVQECGLKPQIKCKQRIKVPQQNLYVGSARNAEPHIQVLSKALAN